MPLTKIQSLGITDGTIVNADINASAAITLAKLSGVNDAKAWVNFNGSGTVAIRASFNVTSITDLGAGQYRVNFTTAMPDANYCAVITHENIDYGGTSFIQSVAGMTASAIEIASYDIAGLKYQDTDIYCVAIFR